MRASPSQSKAYTERKGWPAHKQNAIPRALGWATEGFSCLKHHLFLGFLSSSLWWRDTIITASSQTWYRPSLPLQHSCGSGLATADLETFLPSQERKPMVGSTAASVSSLLLGQQLQYTLNQSISFSTLSPKSQLLIGGNQQANSKLRQRHFKIQSGSLQRTVEGFYWTSRETYHNQTDPQKNRF